MGLIILVAAVVYEADRFISNKGDYNLHKTGSPAQSSLSLSSPAFAEGGDIPAKYTCKGKNISPPLAINNVPADTKSLALIMHDPDAPAGDWLHWTVWNIEPGTNKISENSVPAGAIQGQTSFGKIGYGGPCPPSGTHHYVFTLYALDKSLDLKSGASRAELEQAISGHDIGHTTLTGLFGS